mmetsp:Transcript_2296/g.10426  ORF Transcript_2296/g.10426 Transcript_2296/m.10426 type:complete len:224 (+) Transcript_2296:1357-2028(+)
MLDIGYAPARVALPHGRVHDDDDDGAEDRFTDDGGAPGGATDLLDVDLLRGPAVRRGDVVHRAGSRATAGSSAADGVSVVATLRRRRRVHRRGVLPHTGVRRAGVHDGPGPRVHDQVHRAVDGHVSAHQRGGAGHGRHLDRLRGFAVFAQGALFQLCGARGIAVVGTARGAGPARDMDRGVCEPAVTSESARGARVAGRGARPPGSIRGEDGYDGRRRRRHLM